MRGPQGREQGKAGCWDGPSSLTHVHSGSLVPNLGYGNREGEHPHCAKPAPQSDHGLAISCWKIEGESGRKQLARGSAHPAGNKQAVTVGFPLVPPRGALGPVSPRV